MNPFLSDGSPNPKFSGGGFMARTHALMHQVACHIDRDQYIKEALFEKFTHSSTDGLSNLYREVANGAKLPEAPPGKALYISSSGMLLRVEENGHLHTCKVRLRHDCNGKAPE
jgi:hypothetical protein